MLDVRGKAIAMQKPKETLQLFSRGCFSLLESVDLVRDRSRSDELPPGVATRPRTAKIVYLSQETVKGKASTASTVENSFNRAQ
jgi:hypothetical protein